MRSVGMASPDRRISRAMLTIRKYTDEARLHAGLAQLRADAPVSWVEVPGYAPFWAITNACRHRGDRARQRHLHQLAAPGAGPPGRATSNRAALGIRTLIHADDPLHRDLRAIRANWFRPKAMRALKDRADEPAERFVDKMAAEGPGGDFVQQVAVNYPLYMIMTLLGVPGPTSRSCSGSPR